MPYRPKDSRSLSTDEGRDARARQVAADVTSRLAGVCAAFPPDEFAALVRRIAEITVKYEAVAELRAARVEFRPQPPLT
jgi:hypothetical protein